MPDTTDLIGEIATLKVMLIASEARNLRNDERIERLEKLVAAFKQAAFGRRSEKSDPDQFELALEDLETAIAVIHAEEDTEDRAAKRPAKPRAANRGLLPKHLPRIEEVIEPDSLICACGGCLHCCVFREDVTDRLDIIPAQGSDDVTAPLCGSSQTHLGTEMPSGGGYIIRAVSMARSTTSAWTGATCGRCWRQDSQSMMRSRT